MLYPRYIAKLFCGKWWVMFYLEEHVSVLNKPFESPLDAELDAATKNVILFTEVKEDIKNAVNKM